MNDKKNRIYGAIIKDKPRNNIDINSNIVVELYSKSHSQDATTKKAKASDTAPKKVTPPDSTTEDSVISKTIPEKITPTRASKKQKKSTISPKPKGKRVLPKSATKSHTQKKPSATKASVSEPTKPNTDLQNNTTPAITPTADTTLGKAVIPENIPTEDTPDKATQIDKTNTTTSIALHHGANVRQITHQVVSGVKQTTSKFVRIVNSTSIKSKIKKSMKNALDFSSKQISKTELLKKNNITPANTAAQAVSTEQNLYDIVECFVTVSYNFFGLLHFCYNYLFVQLPPKVGNVIRNTLLLSRGFFNNLSTPFSEIGKIVFDYKKKYLWTPTDKKTKAQGIFAMLRPISKQLERILDYILPIGAITVLAWVIIYMNSLNYMLKITYDGTLIGYVKNERDYYLAEKAMKERILEDDTYEFSTKPPAMELVIGSDENITDIDTMTNKLTRTLSKNAVESDGIYIDGIFLGAVNDGQEFLLYIDSILSEYRNDPEYVKVEFEKRVQVKSGIYPKSSLTNLLELKKHIETNQTHTKTIKTVSGDTLQKLAEKNNTTIENIFSLNKDLPTLLGISSTDLNENFDKEKISTMNLPVGEELAVNTIGLNLGIKVTRLEVYKEKIPYQTEYQYDERYPTTYTETIRSGVSGQREVTANVMYVDGEKIGEQRLNEDILSSPVTAIVKRGTIKPGQYIPPGSSNAVSYLWPVAGGRVTYGLYEYRGHTGMDIAAPYGTPIYASREGTVTYASNYSSGPYGKRVDLNHGDGTITRYAHQSSVIVTPGQYVRRGQIIGYVGSTGNSTGNHLHFEIRINGKIMNPAEFIGKVYPGKQNLG